MEENKVLEDLSEEQAVKVANTQETVDTSLEEDDIIIIEEDTGKDQKSRGKRTLDENDDFFDDDDDEYIRPKRRVAPYESALKSIIFGCISIVAPMFSIVIMFLGGYPVSIALSTASIVFAVKAMNAVKKIHAPLDDKSRDMLRVGKTLGIIGTVMSSLALAYIIMQFIIFIVTVMSLVCLYAFLFLIIILAPTGI